MTASPALLAAIAEVCAWHGRLLAMHPTRVLRDGGRQEILPPEIPQAIRNGEIEVPEGLVAKLSTIGFLNASTTSRMSE